MIQGYWFLCHVCRYPWGTTINIIFAWTTLQGSTIFSATELSDNYVSLKRSLRHKIRRRISRALGHTRTHFPRTWIVRSTIWIRITSSFIKWRARCHSYSYISKCVIFILEGWKSSFFMRDVYSDKSKRLKLMTCSSTTRTEIGPHRNVRRNSRSKLYTCSVPFSGSL